VKIIGNLHALLRCVLMFAHLLIGVALVLGYRIRFGPRWYIRPAGLAMKRWWMLNMNSLLGIRVAQYGRIDRQPLLYVANHVSFLDILVISAITDVRFLSKHTLRYWPIFGTMASLSGTLFIKRGKSNLIARIISTLRDALTESHVVVFPEGTTSLGDDVKHFHAGLFQAAIDAQVPVQSIGIRYLYQGQLDRTAAYIGKDNLLVKLWRLLERSYTDVHLIFNEALPSQGQTRQTLAQLTHAQIEQQLANTHYVALR
jgi:1-acyl-sn-glycerol-3-phosphate acyltransferase